MASYLLEHYDAFIFGGDPYVRQFFLLKSIKPMVTIVSVYVIFVLFIGPALMRKRKPFQMRKMIIYYNFTLVAYYLYFLIVGVYFIYRLGARTFCDSTLDSTKSPFIANFYLHGYIMYVVRYIELVDTVFLVLSKKFKMVTPLHVFHHAVVPVFGWFAFRSEKSGYLAAFMGLNSVIHIIMYSYYAVAALGPEYYKYLWWKKYLTFMQIFQFLIMSFYLTTIYIFGCVTSKFTIVFVFALSVLFFFLFIDYYQRTFRKATKRKMSQNESSVYKQNLHFNKME